MSVIYADWSNVTLAEYAALDIIRRDDAEQLLNRYWDRLRADRAVIELNGIADDDPPTRLTPEGQSWLAELHTTVVSTLDERELIAAARDFVRNMGTLLTVNVAREVRQ